MPTQEEYQREIKKWKKVAEEACEELGGYVDTLSERPLCPYFSDPCDDCMIRDQIEMKNIAGNVNTGPCWMASFLDDPMPVDKINNQIGVSDVRVHQCPGCGHYITYVENGRTLVCLNYGCRENFPFPLSRYDIFCPHCDTELVEGECPHCGYVSDDPINLNEEEE